MGTIGQNIRAYRIFAGLTQTALAEKVGVSRTSIRQWETDANTPRLRSLIKIAEVTNTTLGKLLGEEE